MAVPKNSDPVPQNSSDDRQDHVLPGPVIGLPPANDNAIGFSGGRDRAFLLHPGDVSHRHGADADIKPDGHPHCHGGVAKPAATPGAVVRGAWAFRGINKKPSRAGWFLDFQIGTPTFLPAIRPALWSATMPSATLLIR